MKGLAYKSKMTVISRTHVVATDTQVTRSWTELTAVVYTRILRYLYKINKSGDRDDQEHPRDDGFQTQDMTVRHVKAHKCYHIFSEELLSELQ